MSDFYNNLDPGQAMKFDSLSRLAYAARDARAGLLAYHGVDGEDALEARIASGALAEHPAWEHYVGARILSATREAAREAMQGRDSLLESLPHVAIREAIEDEFAGVLAAPVGMTLDALEVVLQSGVRLTIHAASADAYSFAWHGGDAAHRASIDTAPCHRALAGFPAHRHHADGRVLADTLTRAGADPVANARAVVAALVANPRFGLED